jgi:hypothetical protein
LQRSQKVYGYGNLSIIIIFQIIFSFFLRKNNFSTLFFKQLRCIVPYPKEVFISSQKI